MDIFSVSNLISIYSILSGIMIIGTWFFLFKQNRLNELHMRRMEMTSHLIAEIITAILLIIAGVGLLLNIAWATIISPVSLGMLFYAIVNISGRYVEDRDTVMVIILTVAAALTAIAIVASLG